MSKTSDQIGSPQGYACVDPDHFSNPKQSAGCEGQNANEGANPSFQPTKTRADNDQTVKMPATPHVGDMKGVNKVQVTPRSVYENYGK